MLDKAKAFMTILLVIILVVAVGSSAVKLVMSSFETPNLVTSDNINEYRQDKNTIVGYSTFYYLKDCFENFVEACNQKQYSQLYDLYIKDYSKQYKKEEVLAKLNGLKWETETMDQHIEYKLEKAYILENGYLLEISLDGKKLYLIFDISSSKEYNYTWAFVK